MSTLALNYDGDCVIWCAGLIDIDSLPTLPRQHYQSPELRKPETDYSAF